MLRNVLMLIVLGFAVALIYAAVNPGSSKKDE